MRYTCWRSTNVDADSKLAPGPRGSNKELRRMSFAQFRADAKRARSQRRLYARINAMPSSTVREELLAIAQRHELEQS